MVWVAGFFFALSLLFALFGNIGMLVFPDIYTRLNASSKCSTTGVISIFIGCILLGGLSRMSSRIPAIALLLRNLFSSVIVLGVFSFVTALLFCYWHAPDLAVVEADVGRGAHGGRRRRLFRSLARAVGELDGAHCSRR